MLEGPTPREPIRFGDFEVLRDSFDVSKSGTHLHIQEQPYRVLLVLLEHAGEIVSHEQLKAALAPSAEFGDFDHMIRVSINKLRSIFSDSAISPRYIETVHGHGYRFIAPLDHSPQPKVELPVAPRLPPAVAESTIQSPPRAWKKRLALVSSAFLVAVAVAIAILLVVSARWSPRPIRSLAVLPLINLSGDTNQQYLADGLTEELINDLSGIPGLRVISRTSVMHYREGNTPLSTIARDLGVDAVVEGSVHRSENRVRVNIRLVRTIAEQPIWTQSYNRETKDVLLLRDELAATIADQIDLALGPRAVPAGSSTSIKPEAYEAFLRGKYLEHKQQYAKAVENYREAVKLDPSYAQAYASLAHAASTLSYMQGLPPSSFWILAGAKAMQLDPNLAEAHINVGDLKFFWDWDWSAGEAEFRRAIELDPNSVEARSHYGAALWMLGRYQEAESQLNQALQLDPLSSSVNLQYINLLRSRGDDSSALQHLEKIIERDTNHAAVYATLGATYENMNRPKDALEAYLLADSKSGFAADQIASFRQAFNSQGLRGYWRKRLETAENKQNQEIPLTERAGMYVHTGDYDRAFELLEEAYVRRSPLLTGIRSDPDWAPLRSDPRYKALILRMKFPQ